MITSTKRGGNATERSAAQFVRNLCEQRTRKPVLRHYAEIAVGVDFVPDRRGPVGASAALRRTARSAFLKQSERVDDDPRTGSGGRNGDSKQKQKQYNFTLRRTCTLQAPSFPIFSLLLDDCRPRGIGRPPPRHALSTAKARPTDETSYRRVDTRLDCGRSLGDGGL